MMKFELLVTIVGKGFSSDVIAAATEAGAEGATVLYGRGSGIHERAKFFGILIEPEKEVVIIMVDTEIRDTVMKAIAKGIEIDKPGHGICFSMDITKVVGISHLHLLCDDDIDCQNSGQ